MFDENECSNPGCIQLRTELSCMCYHCTEDDWESIGMVHPSTRFRERQEDVKTSQGLADLFDDNETEEKVKGVITLTGRMETFPVKKTTLDILKMTARIIKVAKQISEAYQAEF